MDSEDLPDIPDEPLEYQWRPRTLTNIPAELVAGCAQGLEDPDEIAARFGLYGENWQQIKEAAMGAEMVLEKVIVDLMSNETGTNTRLEGLKTLAKLANLEPKEDKGAAAGPGFQININLPGNNVTLGGQTVPLTPQIQPIDVLEIPLEDDE